MPAAKQLHKRRPRDPLSCDLCRTRKLRCNREKPCQNCIARDEQTQCKYKGDSSGSTPLPRPDGHNERMRQRIHQLELLVKNLISEHQEKPSYNTFYNTDDSRGVTNFSTSGEIPNGPEVTSKRNTTMIDQAHSVYKVADDWHEVLEEINNLKQAWSEAQDERVPHGSEIPISNIVDGASLLFGHIESIDFSEILATLPPKPEVDRLLDQFFDYEHFPINVPPILHEATFVREYENYWRSPSRTSAIFIGLLFSILGVVMLSYHQYGEPPEYEGISETLFQLYRRRTAQCLIIGDIAKCLPYTVETLRLNATAELNRKDDNRRGLWIMTGVIVRVAINMGYHRDTCGSSTPSISVLQAEYRRRVWLSVVSMENMTSFLAGFPRMMPAIYSDTEEPRNLYLWELSENTSVLPPSRPMTETTPVTYLIAKGRLFNCLGRIADLNNIPSSGNYEIVLDIDRSLLHTYEDLPAHMKLNMDGHNGPLDMPKRASDISNFSLAASYHYGICILHRRFIATDRSNKTYELSRTRCIYSASALLAFQSLLEPAWYQSGDTRRMITLANMILFLELEFQRRIPDNKTVFDQHPLFKALEKSCEFWGMAKDCCSEAQRAYQIMVTMLASFRIPVDNSSSRTSISQQNTVQIPGWNPHISNSNPPLDQLHGAVDIDWAVWDSFINDSNFGDTLSL